MDNNEVHFSRAHGWSYSLLDAYRKQLHTDLTLICEGHALKVHRTVLASLSPFFQRLLSSFDSSDQIIVMEDYKYPIMKLLVNYFYQGSVDGTPDELVTLSEYAKELSVKGLLPTDNSGTKPMNVVLMETKQAVCLELRKLETYGTADECDSCSSSDDEEISILYESKDSKASQNMKTPCSKSSDAIPECHAKNSSTNHKENARKSVICPPTAGVQPPAKKRKKRNGILGLNEGCPSEKKLQPDPTVDSKGAPVINPATNPPKLIKCSVCKQPFVWRNDLKDHISMQHADLLTCKICNKIYMNRATLRKHLLKHITELDAELGKADPKSANPNSNVQIKPA